MSVHPEYDNPKGRSEVVFRPLDDSWVLFDPAAERLHVLNLSAALVWAHLDGESTLETVAERVGSAFDPPKPAAEVIADVQQTVERFSDAGLLDNTQAQ